MGTADGTWRYRDRFGGSYGRTFFRRYPPGVCSSIGLGTYLGAATDERDEAYVEAIVEGLEHGVNVVDTAINYRNQRSERAVGEAIERADIDRESIVVSTKGGFLPFDRERPADPSQYIRETFIDSGRVDPAGLVRGSHCIEPAFIDDQLDASLANLGVETIDCYYVHNPETQLLERDPAAVYDTLESTFERLERRRATGDIRQYGLATWHAFRTPSSDDRHLSLARLLDLAASAADRVGTVEHGLTTIQLPFNVHMADAFTQKCQTVTAADGTTRSVSALEFAHEHGLFVFTSASIGQGELSEGLPADIAETVAGDTATQRAINFARSAPGVTCSLIGTGSRLHLAENAAAGTFDPLGASAFDAVFE
ncbi:aldo/keto reductase [Halalkalirubrum salinum]|uniref:aldo/keto reductase n=1 Tax=Halalkalirubrum salinum TaxID=2563889 RepID=UPI0010FB0E82|nr:aldo/keto reductase [Halalkalirubrum salinum]